ncbi:MULTISPECIES: methyltransferase domain-containing protein [Streptomyces]|uniref:methyltransferase domain-containing protein n=1 Tax=Streptomyces TaxID=1883 RepID=UPI00142F1CD8|nr:methyltransferase domain-containing protein [Streptomyces marokkonensis]
MDEAQGTGAAQDGPAAAGHDRTEVGGFYDRFTRLTLGNAPGANLHYGYWTSPDDSATFEEAAAQLTALMIQEVRLPASGHLLDVGCGIGGPAVQLARVTGAEVTGITVSHDQVTLANRLAADLGLADRVRFEYADAMELPYADASFDASWLLESIIHMPDRGHVLKEIARVVRPRGRVVFTDLCERSPLTADEQSTVDEFFQAAKMSPMVTLDSYPRLVREAGLVLDEVRDISDNVMWRTTRELSRQMREARAEIDEKFASDPAYQLDPARLSDITALGYVLVVAHCP